MAMKEWRDKGTDPVSVDSLTLGIGYEFDVASIPRRWANLTASFTAGGVPPWGTRVSGLIH